MNLKGFRASFDLILEDGIPDFVHGISDFSEKNQYILIVCIDNTLVESEVEPLKFNACIVAWMAPPII